MVSSQMGSLCLFAFAFVIFLCLQTGDAITCYECNSSNDSKCAQENPPDQYKKNCSEHKDTNKYTLCRKIVQSIEFEVNGLKPDTRVIRTCGWDKSNYADRCYQRSGFGGRQEVCTCQNDLCNSAGRYETPLITIAAATALQILAARYF